MKERIAVFRALQLGDMLCAVPALRALRARYPAARITLIGLPWAAAFASRFARYLDDFIAFPGHPGLPEQPAADEAAFARFLDEARSRRFDLAVQLHGSGRITNGIVGRFGAAALAGFYPSAGPDEASQGLGVSLPYPEQGTEVRRLLALAERLGASAEDASLEFPLDGNDEAELGAFAAERRLPTGPCICLHPGARAADKRWPPESFAAVGDALYKRFGLPVVITGSQAEYALGEAVRAAMRAPAANAAGAISVGALAAQIARARLLVSNDTGVSHVAAALRVPSVVVFVATDLERWAPLDRLLHRPVWDPSGRLTAQVLAHARALLEAPATGRAPAPSPLPG